MCEGSEKRPELVDLHGALPGGPAIPRGDATITGLNRLTD